MHNDDEASPSIILAGLALLVKMLITLKIPGIFGSNFVYLCILTRDVIRSPDIQTFKSRSEIRIQF